MNALRMVSCAACAALLLAAVPAARAQGSWQQAMAREHRWALLANEAHQAAYRGDCQAAARHAGEMAEWLNAYPANDPRRALNGISLAMVHLNCRRTDDALRVARQAVADAERSGGEEPLLANMLTSLAGMFQAELRPEAAVPLLRRAVAILEKLYGADDPRLLANLVNLGAALSTLRSPEAEGVLRRAVQAGAATPLQAMWPLSLLGSYYVACGRYAEAAESLERALSLGESAAGRNSPTLVSTLQELSRVRAEQGRYDEAEQLLRRAMDNYAGAELARPNDFMALRFARLRAELREKQGRAAEADALYRQVQEEMDRLGPQFERAQLDTLYRLVRLNLGLGRPAEALRYARKASAVVATHYAHGQREGVADILGERPPSQRAFFLLHLRVLADLALAQPAAQIPLDEVFTLMQRNRAGSAAKALARMAARFSAGEDRLAALVREHQDRTAARASLERRLLQELGRTLQARDPAQAEQLKVALAAADARLQEIDRTLQAEFPAYRQLAQPQPLILQEAQALLGPDEALLLFAAGESDTFVMAVRPGRALFFRAGIGEGGIAASVRKLRASLDPSQNPALAPFDTGEAHRLYRALMAPAEALLKDANHVMVVPDGALQSLPFAVLVSEPQGTPAGASDHARVKWLLKRHAFSTLPAVESLQGLRRLARASAAPAPFAGFGDPLLEGQGAGARNLVPVAVFSQDSPVADVELIRQAMRLPETAAEIRAMARLFQAGDADLYLGGRATEANVKSADLARYRVLAFATHGVMAGELAGMAEAGLVLTPPARGSEADDGYLAVGEIARLKLDADWVLLSACNTAAPDGQPSAEGLSGLAKAFIFAGGRSLLVSHWPVESQSAQELTTATVRQWRAGATKAEALRRASLELMGNAGRPDYAHPMFWAPFVVVGEGAGAGRGSRP